MIRLKNPNSYIHFPDVPRIGELPPKIGPEDLVEIVYRGLSATTQNKEIAELIEEFQKIAANKNEVIFKSIKRTIQETKAKIEKNIALSDKERRDLANDIVLAVCLDFVTKGTKIPLVGHDPKGRET